METRVAGVTELISRERIAERVRALAAEIVEARAAEPANDFVVLVMLKGAFVFAADLVRELDAAGAEPPIDFLTASSYGARTVSSGHVKLQTPPRIDLVGKDVLVVDDILDTGRSLSAVRNWLTDRGASRVRICVLLDKPSRRVEDIRPDHCGFEVEDRFVVGYGLDHDEHYRHLPYVGVLDA
jgi:hypoxanthine phosphoribosyltransferase